MPLRKSTNDLLYVLVLDVVSSNYASHAPLNFWAASPTRSRSTSAAAQLERSH